MNVPRRVTLALMLPVRLAARSMVLICTTDAATAARTLLSARGWTWARVRVAAIDPERDADRTNSTTRLTEALADPLRVRVRLCAWERVRVALMLPDLAAERLNVPARATVADTAPDRLAVRLNVPRRTTDAAGAEAERVTERGNVVPVLALVHVAMALRSRRMGERLGYRRRYENSGTG